MPRITLWTGASIPGVIRLAFPAKAIDRPADVKVGSPGLRWNRAFEGPPPADARVVGVAEHHADVVVVRAPHERWMLDGLVHLKRAGVRVVVDVDVLYDVGRGKVKGIEPGLEVHDEACRVADLVTAATPELVRHYGYGHGFVLPNLVPKSYLEIEPGECKKAIGWTGLLAAHPGDLEVTGGEVGRALVGRPDWDMGVLGEPKKSAGLVSTALGLLSEPVLDPFVDIRDYPYRMAEYGIGIVPLADTPFNAAKSALKMAQFAALGVPVVASPSPDNSRLNALGVGVLAADPHKWRRHLNRLVDSADARADLAGRGREVMATQTYERHADRWWRAWTGWM